MKSNRLKLVFVRLLWMGVLVLFTGFFAKAQNLVSISGKVQDASGAAIPDASITVTSAETGTTRSVTSDDQGDYRVLSIPVGRYQIKAEKTGFKTYVQSGIELVVGQQAVVNLALEVGQVQQQVVVTADVPVVNTSTVSTAGLVQEQQIKDLPLNGRSFDNLITLNAGAANVTSNKTGGAGAENGNLFSVSGRVYWDNLFLMNGVVYPGPTQPHSVPGGVSGQLLGIDAVREFNVQSNAYDAQYGQRAGGQVNVVSMSGTNQLHGSVFEFIRNSVFDARNTFDHPIGYRIPPFKRNQFGGAVGGPIRKDKTFLFGNYEGFRQRLNISDALFVPDNNAQLGLTDASLPPAGSLFCPPGPAYPGLVKTMLPYLAANYPAQNGVCLGGGIARAFYAPLSKIREDFGIVRLDQIFSAKDSLSISHLFDDGRSIIPQLDPTFANDSTIRTQVLSVQETHIFSPNLINIATFGYSLAFWRFVEPALVTIPPALQLVPGQPEGRFSIGGGGLSGAISPGGGGIASNVRTHTSRQTYADAIQLSKGRHQFGAGVWFQPLYSNETFPSHNGGSPAFASLAQFMMGIVQTFNVAPVITPMHWKQLQGAWYVQDIIQVRPNLTVRLGLRHEFTGAWTEAKGQSSQFVRGSDGLLITTPVIGSHPFSVNNGKYLFGPRVGIAYDPFGKGKTSIRAGFGTHYNLQDTLGWQLENAPPFNGVVSFLNANFLSLVPFNTSAPLPPQCNVGVVGTCTTYAVGGSPTNLKIPTVEEWNLSIEQGITANTSITIGYVGSHQFHGIINVDPNAIVPQTCAVAAGCLAGGVNSSSGLVPQGTFYVPTGKLPNPFLANGGNYLMSEGNNSYNGMEVGFKHRLSHGLQFQVNYTWSKAEDFETGYSADNGNSSGRLTNPYNPQYDWGPSAYNKKHKLSANAAYQLPIGQGKRWLNGGGAVNKVVGGWQFNTIFTATSGFPIITAGSTSILGNTTTASLDHPYFNPTFTGNVVTGNPNNWFNPAAFTLCAPWSPPACAASVAQSISNLQNGLPAIPVASPAFGTFGNIGRDIFTGPNLIDLDMSLFKKTSITERVSAEFRVEGFNVLNRANYGAPSMTIYSGTTLSPTEGAVTVTATTSRQLQFGLKILF